MVPSEPRGRLPFTVGGEETTANGRGAAYVGRFPELEDALVERVLELRRGRPLAPLTIVVGSSSVRTRVGDLLVRRLGAIANVWVVTLSRLAADLVIAARGAPRPTLAGIARERLIRRLVASRELAYFAPVQDRPHFPRAVAATFADLREARVAPASDWARTAFRQGAAADTPSSEAKAADLQGLYAAYCDELARRSLADGAQLLLEAAEAVRRTHAATEPADRPRVVLYGIYDLNQAQEAFVRELLGAGADLFVPVPRGGSGDGAGALDAARAAGFAERALVPPDPVADHERLAELWRAGPPFARRAVVDLLGAAPLRDSVSSQREIALWLDEARQAGVVSGLDQWQERIARRRNGLEQRVAD